MHIYDWIDHKINTEVKGVVTFHYNSDFSGDVIVVVEGKEMKVPAHALLAFVGYCHVATKRINVIEGMKYTELLK